MNKIILKTAMSILVFLTVVNCIKKDNNDDQEIALLLFALNGANVATCTIESGSTVTRFPSTNALTVPQSIKFSETNGVKYAGVEAKSISVLQKVVFKNTGATVTAFKSTTCRNVIGVTSNANTELLESNSGNDRTFTVKPGGAGDFFFIVTVPAAVDTSLFTVGIE